MREEDLKNNQDNFTGEQGAGDAENLANNEEAKGGTGTDGAGTNSSGDGGIETGDVHKELQTVKTQAAEYLQLLQRTQADFENFRRRSRQEKEDTLRYGAAKLAENLLPVLDNFERALNAEGQDLENFLSGVALILRQFQETLKKEGIVPIEAVGTEFDPCLHEAVMTVESTEHADNTVVEELQKGYFLHDKVIRPAMVKVAKN